MRGHRHSINVPENVESSHKIITQVQMINLNLMLSGSTRTKIINLKLKYDGELNNTTYQYGLKSFPMLKIKILNYF